MSTSTESKLFQTMKQLLPNLSNDELTKIKYVVDKMYIELNPVLSVVEIQPIVEETFANQDIKNVTDSNRESAIEQLLSKLSYTPSSYQLAVLDWILNGSKHGIVGATAGSGKTSTLKLIAQLLQIINFNISDVRIVVFGKQNSLDIVKKLGKEWEPSISTLHSLGWGMIKSHLNIKGKVKVSDFKYRQIFKDLKLFAKDGLLAKNKSINEYEFNKLVHLIRLTFLNIDKNDVEYIATEYTFESIKIADIELITNCLKTCLDIGEKQARDKICFDFTDQIYLPCKWNLKAEQTYKFVLVDECQDLNRCQFHIVRSILANDGRVLSVGDEHQSIMGFAGAMSDSFQQLKTFFDAQELPLSICYRCPKKHVGWVNRLFPEIKIEAFDKNQDGTIQVLEENKLSNVLKEVLKTSEPIILCRKTAPLVNHCIKLIAEGLPAKVKGKDIGETLKKDLKEIGSIQGFTYDKFNEYLDKYRNLKILTFCNRPNYEELLDGLNDKLEAIFYIYESQVNAVNISDLENYIDSLFTDETTPVSLQTAHRSKGAESKNVFMLDCKSMLMRRKGQLQWQYQQEQNLLYVALTRSMENYYLVFNKDEIVRQNYPTWVEAANIQSV